jgi:hypothetical protein
MLLIALALWLGSGVIILVVLGAVVLLRDRAKRGTTTARLEEPAPQQATLAPAEADRPARAEEPASRGR